MEMGASSFHYSDSIIIGLLSYLQLGLHIINKLH